MAKILGVRGARLAVAKTGVIPPRTPLGIAVMSMDLLLASDAAPLTWGAPTQQEAHTWRGTTEANAIREFLADTEWGALDALVLDLPPGTDRLATILSLVPGPVATLIVTIPSDVSQLVVRRSVTAAREAGARLLGLVENMADLFPGPDTAAMAREAGIALLGRVPFDRALAAAADEGRVFVTGSPASPAARALVNVAGAIRADLEAPAPAGAQASGGMGF
jgi:ATP-binding protein involved in chromosome partitioning